MTVCEGQGSDPCLIIGRAGSPEVACRHHWYAPFFSVAAILRNNTLSIVRSKYIKGSKERYLLGQNTSMLYVCPNK